MKTRNSVIISLVLVTALFSLFTACAQEDAELSDGISIEGDKLIIQLDENPTTGFTWQMDEFDHNILVLVNDEYIPDAAETDIVGSGGKHSFEFKGVNEGETTLSFHYYKSWEKVETAEDNREFTVTVNPDGSISDVD